MLAKHIHSPVIEKVIFSNTNAELDGNEKVLSGDFYVYNEFSGNCFPATYLSLKGVGTLTTSDVSLFDGQGYDPQHYKIKEHYLTYDNKGRVISGKLEGGVTSFIKQSDADNNLKIADITNVESGTFFYTSFESEKEGRSDDFQLINQNHSAIILESRTGIRSVNLDDASIQKTNIPVGKYILSFWSKKTNSSGYHSDPISSSLIIEKQVSPKKVNGWEYNYYVLTITASNQTITINGGFELIDEMRLYPIDAQMNTYTYFPSGQIRSVTNAQDQTTFYEYDLMHRLKFIRDSDGYIVQELQYHQASLIDSNY
ncbi:MAG: RHS repeat protein [Flavobacteriales bacterium]|nr:RHS repeat protein [Flavobacteriales bacterium]